MNFPNLSRFRKAYLVAVVAVLFIGAYDVYAAHSGVFGTPEEYTNGNYEPRSWWNVFRYAGMSILAIVAVSYYVFGKQDVYEAAALFMSGYFLWRFGLSDAFYFLIQGQPIPATLPWLGGVPLMTIANWMGSTVVTMQSLLVSIMAGFGFTYALSSQLEKVQS